MRWKAVLPALTLCLTATVGSVSAQAVCGKLPTSTGPVPPGLFDSCWIGPSPAPSPELPSDFAHGPEMANALFVNLMLNAPEVLNTIAPFNTTNFTGGCEFAYSDYTTMYCADTANNWFTIDTATGARNPIGTLDPIPPNAETVTGLAFDRINHQMYVCTTNVSTSSLLTVLPSGSTNLVGTITNAPAMIACAMDPAGNLWGYEIVNDTFLSIDTTTGAGTVVGPLSFNANFGQGMDFDESDGACYLFAFNDTTFQSELRTCDPSTGASTLVGVLGATTPSGFTQMPGAGIAAEPFVPLLFGIDEARNGFFGIHEVTGAAQYRSTPPFDYSFSGMAFDTWRRRIYVSDVWSGAWSLVAIDPLTGNHALIGPHVNSSDIHGLAFDPVNDVLYGSDLTNDCLALIDHATGLSTCIGPLGAGADIRGLAYNNHTSMLYGIDGTNLFRVDTMIGDATVVGPHGIPSAFVMGLEYDSASGILFASMGGDITLYALNPGTGTASPYGQHRLAALSGLASITGPGEPCGIFCDGFESGNTLAW